MHLEINIRKIAERYAEYKAKNYILDEENTKNSLVLPLFEVLGHDTSYFPEFRAEYTLDLRNNGYSKVDYAIMVEDKPKIIIEVKKAGEKLEQHIGQLKQYFVSDINVRFGILTNGIEYMFFTDNVNPNVMDDTPFYAINITTLSTEDYKVLGGFKKENVFRVDDEVKRIIVQKQINEFLQNQVIKPGDMFTTFIIKSLGIKGMSNEKLKKAIKDIFDVLLANEDKIVDANEVSETKEDDAYTVGLKESSPKKSRKPRMDTLFAQGIIGKGDEIYIKNRPDDKAIIVDDKTVEYTGNRMSYNQWGKLVTGWTTICIYEWAVLERRNMTLVELRKEVK